MIKDDLKERVEGSGEQANFFFRKRAVITYYKKLSSWGLIGDAVNRTLMIISRL